jgi:hypothetical protein
VTPRKRRILVLSIGGGAVFTVALVTLAARVPFSSDKLRSRVVEALSTHLDAEVELGDLWLRIAPSLHAEGQGLIIRHKGRRDVPPLIAVKTVIIDADVLGLWNHNVARVRLDGLEITIPPGGFDVDDRPDEDTRNPQQPAHGEPVATIGDVERSAVARDAEASDDAKREVVIEELTADDATLTILRSNPAKKPRVWRMHKLYVEQVGARTQMPFQAYLTNAVPPGQIDTTGAFGPWFRDDPGRTPVEGAFTFSNADLSVFKGISGILSAEGTYRGSLERIDVTGKTDTPDFQVTLSGRSVPLKTTYQATVDATNGNTTLQEVDAMFLNTSLIAKGGIYDVEGLPGRVVMLDVDLKQGRLEDVMRLAVKATAAPMTGGLTMTTKLEIPPGDKDVVDKLKLDGAFNIVGGRFTNADVQRKINELSHRARARKADAPRGQVGSDFSGRFLLANARLELRKLTFDVPGAIVELNGQYNLKSEMLDFGGTLFMDAKVSQTVSGWKSLLLKVVDPFFRKNGRTAVPIKISGRRSQPQFGLDAKRVF